MKKKLQIFLVLLLIGFQSFAAPYDQCGGIGWTGQTFCSAGTTCVVANPWFSQCLPCSQTACAPEDPTDPTNPTDPNNPTNPQVKFQRETFTGQKLVVTSVTGTAALKAGLNQGFR